MSKEQVGEGSILFPNVVLKRFDNKMGLQKKRRLKEYV